MLRKRYLMYYVVQVKTGKEEKTIEAIKKQLGNDLDAFDVFAPYRKSLRKYKGEFIYEICIYH